MTRKSTINIEERTSIMKEPFNSARIREITEISLPQSEKLNYIFI